MSVITKHTLDHLAKLARIELGEKEEEKLLADLQKIVEYFSELQSLDTSGIAPMSGGTTLENSFREDTERENTQQGKGTDAFPKTQGGYLKIPPVFSAEGGSPPETDGPRAHASGGE